MAADEEAPEAPESGKGAAIQAALEALRDEQLFWRAKQAVKEEVLKPQYDTAAVGESVGKVLRASGLGAALKNLAYERLCQLRRGHWQVERLCCPGFPLPPPDASAGDLAAAPALGAVEWARRRWATLMLRRLRELSREQQQPFLRPRSAGGACPEGEVSTRHVADLDRLYRLVTSELAARRHGEPGPGAGPGPSLLGRGLFWGALGVHFRGEPLEELRARYQDLAPELGHLGAGGGSQGGGGSAEAELAEQRRADGQALLANPYAPELQLFARLGVPPSLRQAVWSRCLVAPTEGQGGLSALRSAARGVCEWEWITDDVLRLDVAEHCANDVCYFPFDELVEALVLTLSRDAGVPGDCAAGPPQLPLLAGGGVVEGPSPSYCSRAPGPHLVPPCGVVPFRGFSNYACPFAFLADRLEAAYPLFRAFYCRHLARLHTISCQPATLLPLCALFEALVSTAAPHVCYHLAQLGPEAAPLRHALPWIVRGFVGFLGADQVLWLWDRIVGFDSVQLVAVLAAAVFAFRSRVLLSAKTPQDVELVFSDLSALQAVPLLQGFLFAGELGAPGGS